MKINRKLKRILTTLLWSVIAGGVVVLLGAAVKVRYENNCTGYEIEIKGNAAALFLDKDDVEAILTANQSFKITGRPLSTFDLKKLEERIKRNQWVMHAALYFDNANKLNISITEREPVIRVFTSKGESFYVDSTGLILPISDKVTVKVPVFTGFPGESYQLSKSDSLLLNDMLAIQKVLANDSFWQSQIAQVTILPNRNFEWIPMFGDQVIEWGNASDSEAKLKRLTLFYQQVVSAVGINAYSRIKLQYKGQVLGVKYVGEEARAEAMNAAEIVKTLILTSEAEQMRMLSSDTLLLPSANKANGSEQQTAKWKALQDSIQKPGEGLEEETDLQEIKTITTVKKKQQL